MGAGAVAARHLQASNNFHNAIGPTGDPLEVGQAAATKSGAMMAARGKPPLRGGQASVLQPVLGV